MEWWAQSETDVRKVTTVQPAVINAQQKKKENRYIFYDIDNRTTRSYYGMECEWALTVNSLSK